MRDGKSVQSAGDSGLLAESDDLVYNLVERGCSGLYDIRAAASYSAFF